jgi:hypothetical protein
MTNACPNCGHAKEYNGMDEEEPCAWDCIDASEKDTKEHDI